MILYFIIRVYMYAYKCRFRKWLEKARNWHEE